jgi:hypothetical protein
MTDEQRVKAKVRTMYPNARCCNFGWKTGMVHIVAIVNMGNEYISSPCPTEAAAWSDAANKLKEASNG